ncbi:MAG: shikimate kinase, partial [Chitinophagaceae bacterium]|nr:shikimate kinase [Anaerolineae bacterium]
VIAFGAGYSYYQDETLFKRAEQALAPYPNVILLLPSANVEESIQILRERLLAKEPSLSEASLNMNRRFLEHDTNRRLAKMTFYTKNQSPEESCSKIIQQLGLLK